MYLKLNLNVPCHVSILLWVKKVGIYKLNRAKENSNDWILFIDESIEFGHEKLLVILGIRESQIDFTRPIQYQDVTCLRMMVSNSWKGDEIKNILEGLSSELGTIKYVVADMGNSIKRALRQSGLPHIEDLTHKISWFIKELYKDDEEFKSYTGKLAHLRGSLALSKVSHILPPGQRANSRFMNLKPIFQWGMAALEFLNTKKEKSLEQEKLLFLKEYEGLIRETCELIEKANVIQKILKNDGLSVESKDKCIKLFEEDSPSRVKRFKLMMESYFEESLEKMEGTPKLICTSDILESSFGKYKNYISRNISVGITDLSLTIPAFTGKLEANELVKAMEQVQIKRVNNWKSENIGKTQTKKRREILKMGRRKKIFIP